MNDSIKNQLSGKTLGHFNNNNDFDNLYKNFGEELKICGGSFLRGATYKFYGVRRADSTESINPENKKRILYEKLYIEMLKKISKSISPEIHEDFKYPSENENINERIKQVN